ncbi:unnamed protein product [Calypogeia fissa]
MTAPMSPPPTPSVSPEPPPQQPEVPASASPPLPPSPPPPPPSNLNMLPTMNPSPNPPNPPNPPPNPTPISAPIERQQQQQLMNNNNNNSNSNNPMGEESAVRVAVRARPLIEKEIVEKCGECVTYSPDCRQIVLGKDRRFTFDYVFGPTVGQEEVYMDCVKPLVDSCVAGYNATVLAYGQTGSGKTHTMGCGNNTSLLEEELGILPRAIRQLYESIEERNNQAEFLVKCAFVEIYNEEIKDLLHPDTPSKSISIREDANGDIILAGVKEEVVTNYDCMMRFLEHGSVFRTTGSTLMNQQSSRSHAIFTIIVEQRSVLNDATNGDVITAKFHLVDLAGSERAKRTGAVGLRFKESVTINCGLLALGNVISALGDERKRGHHVPYRESKLTRLLQDSLGGNSRTCMIACISTADTNFEETLNTLKYANRARNIRNTPVINRDPQTQQLNQLRLEVRALQVELLNSRLRSMGKEPVTGPQSLETLLEDESHRQFLDDVRSRADETADVSAELLTVRRKSREREQECVKLKQDMKKLESLIAKLQEELLELRTERDHYQLKLDEVNTEMTALLQVLPDWESTGIIASSPRAHLVDLTKRLTGDIDGERNGFDQQCNAPGGHIEKPSSGNGSPQKPPADKDSTNGDKILVKEVVDSSFSRPRSQPDEVHSTTSSRDSPAGRKSDSRGAALNSPGRGTSRGSRNIINQHLRTIRVLEERLALKENDFKVKDEALVDAKEDLARDERIFAEKIKEIKALKKLARDLTEEKQQLLQKSDYDAIIISRMSEEAIAKEDQLAQLRNSLEALQSGRPDACTISGANLAGKSKLDKDIQQSHDSTERDDSFEVEKGDKCELGDQASLASLDTDGQMKIEELTERMKAEEDEKARLLDEKTAIEEQKSRLEEDVRHQTREFKRSKQVMDKQLQELALSIQQKEELIQELARNEAEAKHLTQQYETRMLELEAEMRRKEDEVEALKKELEAIDRNAAKGAEEKKRLREQYEEKVKKITSQLIALKRQRWEQESQRLERQKAKSDVKLQSLQHEITRMRAQQDSLKKKIKETTDKYEDEHERDLKTMTVLKREAENQLRRVRELEMENQKQRMVVRRKNEEMALANKKLKELGVLDGEVSTKLSNRERSLAYAQSHKTVGRQNSAPPIPDSHHLANNVEKTVTTLDSEIGKLLIVREAVALKNKQEVKREEILLEKDECLNERSKMELKHARAVHDISQELERKTILIHEMEKQMVGLQAKADEAKNLGKMEVAADFLGEVMYFDEQCHQERQACASLEAKRKPHKLLTRGEVSLYGDLDERIEALDAQAEYMALSIAEQEKNIQDRGNTIEAVQSQLDSLGSEETKVVLKKYLEKFVEVKDKQRQEAKLVAHLELQLKEKIQAVSEAETNSRLKEIEFDRRLTELHSQHAKEVQYLLKQVETVSANPSAERTNNFRGRTKASTEFLSQENEDASVHTDDSFGRKDDAEELRAAASNQKIAILRQDNFQYKQTNSLLKRKLQEMISSWEAEKKAFENMVQGERHAWESERQAWDHRALSYLEQQESMEMQLEQLDRDRHALKDELENTKALLHKAGLGIRLPVKNVRELTDGDVDLRNISSVPPSRGQSSD